MPGVPLLGEALAYARRWRPRSMAGKAAPWCRRLAIGSVLVAALMLAIVAPELIGSDRLARDLRNLALGALGAGVLVGGGVSLYTRRKANTLDEARPGASGPDAEERERQDQLARAADLARRYRQAQCNLDYWRDFLVPKLHRTIATVLGGAAPDDEQPAPEAPLAAVAEVRSPPPEQSAPLPDPLPELVDGIANELWSVAGRALDVGLGAIGRCLGAAAASARSRADGEITPLRAPVSSPDVGLEAPLLSLQAATETIEQVVIQIGLCLSGINALATASSTSGSLPDAVAETGSVAGQLQGLFEELVTAREHLGTKARELD